MQRHTNRQSARQTMDVINPMNTKHGTTFHKSGDRGITSIGHGVNVSKADAVIEFAGSLDEAQVALGFAAVEANKLALSDICNALQWLQRSLFSTGAVIMEAHGARNAADGDEVDDKEENYSIEQQLTEVDKLIAQFMPAEKLRNFILPGGSELAARIEIARTTCRRLERTYLQMHVREQDMAAAEVDALPYLNRISTLCWTLARHSNQVLEIPETQVRFNHNQNQEQ